MDRNCSNCKYESAPPNSGICLECSEIPATCALWEPQPKTNGDRVRAKTDEELAKLIVSDWCEIVCDSSAPWCDGDCEVKVLEWLKQECE